MKNSTSNEEKKKKRRIIYIILIILLLLLITSCSCSGKFWGKLGDWFVNEGNYEIDNDTNDQEIIKNQDLQFDVDSVEISMSDREAKISFNYKNINPTSFTCSTSDASIATCYVSDGYIVVIPKQPGKVTVTLETETNGKKYIATTEVTITDAKRYISLSSKSGTINLAYSNKKTISYKLVGLSGNVTVTSSDNSVATATASDGIIKITAKSEGKVKITVSVTDNGKTYTNTYNLTVINKKTNAGNTTSDNGNNKPSDSQDSNTEKSTNNYLSSIKSSVYPLNETFSKTRNEYSITVDYDTKSITLNVTLDNSKSKVEYRLDGKTIPSLNNIPLTNTDSKLEIIVTAENGDVNTYVINIHKPVRTIQIENSSYEVSLDGKPFDIIYNILEDGEKIDNYNKDDIKVNLSNYVGKYEIYEDYIRLIPDSSMAGLTSNLTVNYNGKTSTSNLTFKMPEYYLYSYPSAYVISLINGSGYRNLILNTNFFDDSMNVTEIPNGIRISSPTGDIYIDVTTDNDIIDLSLADKTVSDSLVIKASAETEGRANIKVVGYVYGTKINELLLSVTATSKSIVTIDANGGFFDEFTTVYQFQVTTDDVINLSDYEPLMVDKDGNCMYYELKEYNTEPDGSGVVKNKTDILTNITESITLYAVYNDTSVYKELKTNKKLYVTDIDLFHNEEYYKKYNKDKIIYPGAEGYYILNISNNASSNIDITGMTFEEDTICIESKGCLNMGYKVRYAAPSELYKYYFGSSNNYEIVNKVGTRDIANNYSIKDVSFDTPISIPQGSTAEVTVFWKWVEEDDDLDTAIGVEAVNLNDIYELTLNINFETINEYCKLN